MIRCPLPSATFFPGAGDGQTVGLPPQAMERKMPHQSLNQLIRKLESVTTLSEDERKSLLDLPVKVKTLAADEDIVREGDRPSQCCLLAEGFLCRYKIRQTALAQSWRFMCPARFPMRTAFI